MEDNDEKTYFRISDEEESEENELTYHVIEKEIGPVKYRISSLEMPSAYEYITHAH